MQGPAVQSWASEPEAEGQGMHGGGEALSESTSKKKLFSSFTVLLWTPHINNSLHIPSLGKFYKIWSQKVHIILYSIVNNNLSFIFIYPDVQKFHFKDYVIVSPSGIFTILFPWYLLSTYCEPSTVLRGWGYTWEWIWMFWGVDQHMCTCVLSSVVEICLTERDHPEDGS